jgi:hypothetical protein
MLSAPLIFSLSLLCSRGSFSLEKKNSRNNRKGSLYKSLLATRLKYNKCWVVSDEKDERPFMAKWEMRSSALSSRGQPFILLLMQLIIDSGDWRHDRGVTRMTKGPSMKIGTENCSHDSLLTLFSIWIRYEWSKYRQQKLHGISNSTSSVFFTTNEGWRIECRVRVPLPFFLLLQHQKWMKHQYDL